MKESDILKIIVKFINQEANQSELEKLDFWLTNDKNKTTFNNHVKVEYLTAVSMGKYDLKKANASIKAKYEIEKKKKRISFIKKVSFAASIVIFLGISIFQFTNNNSQIDNPIITSSKIEKGTNKAILTLSNGDQISLEKDKKITTNKAKSNGKEIVYFKKNKTKESTKKLSYNYLTIPRGGEFFVQLADGTKVWLNSESQLKYPTEFNAGEPREIELVYGEAYFEVSPSSHHNGDEFNVITKNQIINVLGTHFNIKAYSEDKTIATTLVEGKVLVSVNGNKKTLKPNQQSKTEKGSNTIKIEEVDVSQEVAWVKRMFSFNEVSLEEMMKVLSRWYSVEVVFESHKKKGYLFTGVLERTNSIQNILKLIEATSESEIKFEIEKSKITIK